MKDERRRIEKLILSESSVYFQDAWNRGEFEFRPAVVTTKGVRIEAESEEAITQARIDSARGIVGTAVAPGASLPCGL